MPRISPSGKYIFPASEVGEFTVCPMAWFLKRVKTVPILETYSSDSGSKLHEQWAKQVEDGFKIGRLLRLLIAFVMGATTILLLVSQ